MIFNSFNFIVLFPFIFLLYYAIPAGHGRARNLSGRGTCSCSL